MEYYIYAILDVIYTYSFELAYISLGLILLAWMDFISFQRPPDTGYFSIHTRGSKRDAWHDAKKLAILCFAIAAIGEVQLVKLAHNPYIIIAFLAYFWQRVIYNFLLKLIKRLFNF